MHASMQGQNDCAIKLSGHCALHSSRLQLLDADHCLWLWPSFAVTVHNCLHPFSLFKPPHGIKTSCLKPGLNAEAP